jgi:hypothetical protein
MRTLIYEHACLCGVIAMPRAAISLLEFSEPDSPHTQPHHGASALLHTCRQIRYETLPIFYNNTMFDFRLLSIRQSIDTLDALDAEVRNNIRYIKLWEVLIHIVSAKLVKRHLTSLIWPVELPSLVEVHVHLSKRYAPMRKNNIFEDFEEAARKIFGREDLVARVTIED